MSTRAIYSFDTDYGMVHVYKHHDGYPTGAADALKAAQAYAWPLPRYEGDDYAAAFVAANKIPYFLQPGLEALFGAPCEGNTDNGCVGGGVRLIPQDKKPHEFAADAAYRYQISKDGLMVTAFSCNYWDNADKETFLFSCERAKFQAEAKRWEAYKSA